MSVFETYDPGIFCWVDLATNELGASIEFYGSLFGWQMKEQAAQDDNSHPYVMCTLNGDVVCGMGELPSFLAEKGVPPHWSSYISTNDVDAWCKQAIEHGANVQMGPTDIGAFGRMAMIQDPTGATVGLWQAMEHHGAKVTNVPGSLCWNELATREPEKAASFYGSLCQWESSTQDMGHTSYTTFTSPSGRATAGAVEMTKEWGDAPPHWLPYFTVEQCDDATKRAQELGATVVVAPETIPDVGRFSLLLDPQGASFYLMHLDQPDD